MKILVDTNVFLDILLDRKPFSYRAIEIWQVVENSDIIGFISSSVLTDIYFIARKKLDDQNVRQFLLDIITVFNVTNVDHKVAQKAILSNFKDFEDAIQNFSAECEGCELIITRNKKDYKESNLGVLTPEEFISEY